MHIVLKLRMYMQKKLFANDLLFINCFDIKFLLLVRKKLSWSSVVFSQKSANVC